MKNFLSWIKAFFGTVEHIFMEYMSIAYPNAKMALMNDLHEIATPIVATLNNSTLSGSEKRNQAFSLIMAELAKIGRDVGASLIYSAIEEAKQYNDEIHAAKVETGPVAVGGNMPGGETVNPAV